MDEILEQIDLDLSKGSIDEQLEDVSFSRGQSDNLLEQIHFDLSTLQEREYELPEDHTMMYEGHKDALDIELAYEKLRGPIGVCQSIPTPVALLISFDESTFEL